MPERLVHTDQISILINGNEFISDTVRIWPSIMRGKPQGPLWTHQNTKLLFICLSTWLFSAFIFIRFLKFCFLSSSLKCGGFTHSVYVRWVVLLLNAPKCTINRADAGYFHQLPNTGALLQVPNSYISWKTGTAVFVYLDKMWISSFSPSRGLS